MNLDSLTHVVEYMGNPDRSNWASPHDWTVMAAFDGPQAAQNYLKRMQKDPPIDPDVEDESPWIYRVTRIPTHMLDKREMI